MEDKSHSFSNPPVRLDLPRLLPLKLEKSLLLHSWSLTKIYLSLPAQKGQEESSVHSGVLGIERAGSITSAAMASVAGTVVPEAREPAPASGRATACPHLEEGIRPFCPKASSYFLLTRILVMTSLSWLPCFPFHTQSKIGSTVHTVMPIYPRIPTTTQFSMPAVSPCSVPCGPNASCWSLTNSSTSTAQENFSQTWLTFPSFVSMKLKQEHVRHLMPAVYLCSSFYCLTSTKEPGLLAKSLSCVDF